MYYRYAIDTIILTAIVQVASFVSNYCWLLWLGVSFHCLQITLHALYILPTFYVVHYLTLLESP